MRGQRRLIARKRHGYGEPFGFDLRSEVRMIAGGAAAADFDGDGWTDLFVVRGDIGPNVLLRNRGDGTFEEVARSAGVADLPLPGSGPLFADLDGDGWPDLVVGAIDFLPPAVYRNRGDGTFEDVSSVSGLSSTGPQYSLSAGDLDGDCDLDLAAAHWIFGVGLSLWRNNGGAFQEITAGALPRGFRTEGFTPVFTDFDADGWFDLLVAGDFGTSAVLVNRRDGTFAPSGDPAITDENGMGAAVGDYDNDGDQDWFVSSIWDPDGVAEGNWGITGNRLYSNTGLGSFEDVTTEAGVREGYWGWGSCFADFNNDGLLDLFHVNGFPVEDTGPYHVFDDFLRDPSRLYIATGGGAFQERSLDLGIDDTRQGRGVVCFDYDADGDLDIFIHNNSQTPRLYRNDGGNAGNFLAIRLAGDPPNTEGVGARIAVSAGGATQVRELHAGSNFASSDPVAAHFGLGDRPFADRIQVSWPDGRTTVLAHVPARRFLTLSPGANPQVHAERAGPLPRPTPPAPGGQLFSGPPSRAHGCAPGHCLFPGTCRTSRP